MGFMLLDRHKTHFVLWVPGGMQDEAPVLVIGKLSTGPPVAFDEKLRKALDAAPNVPSRSLWELSCESLNLPEGGKLPEGVYHYWFEITDTSPEKYGKMLVTDPLAYTVDYGLTELPRDRHVPDREKWKVKQPAGVIKLGKDSAGNVTLLEPCESDGSWKMLQPPNPQNLRDMPKNNQLVIYELPTSWSRVGIRANGRKEFDVGTFEDVRALLDQNITGTNFTDVEEVAKSAHLKKLGINALELLPPADAKPRAEWGYATAHYFAPDYDLGRRDSQQSHQSSVDLKNLVKKCHESKIRFFPDLVMAFGYDPYIYIAYDQFHLRPSEDEDNSDAYQSDRSDELRNGHGGEIWRYIKSTDSYDPEKGNAKQLCPASVFHRAHLEYWMTDFHVGGLRLDSINNIGNYDFLKDFRTAARNLFASRYGRQPGDEDANARFLVVGEELNVPHSLLRKHCVDALWNDHFWRHIRAAIIGEPVSGENFEWTVRKMINCRLLDFGDGAQAVNYITSHDVAGPRRERLYNFLKAVNVYDKERRTKLAFACLLTAVGIPMIFAGEEFCDKHDWEQTNGKKQTDPVNFTRKRDPWRSSVFDCVARLVELRTQNPALSVNDTDFIHVDFSHGRRIMAWVRGRRRSKHVVVVVANFSDVDTPGRKYVVNGWPDTQPGCRWREITQDREVPPNWIGEEPLFHWEAKVYEMYDPDDDRR